MTEVILHHFDSSPFAEKIRLALGVKGIAWYSVEIPMVMPKPDLTALTGGYRKTPVMQIGADVYCDTQRIARELERRFPAPTLFPDNSEGLCLALAHWSDVAFFQPGAGLSMACNTAIPEPVLNDRRDLFSFLDFDHLAEDTPHLWTEFLCHLNRVEQMLRHGSPYLLGDALSWADILAYFPVWMCRGNVPQADEHLQSFPLLGEWEQRVSSFGHGTRMPMSATAALEVAARACPGKLEPGMNHENSATTGDGLALGTLVDVFPRDYGATPVRGELLRNTLTDISIRRSDERLGEVFVHFPRSGYQVDQAL